MKDLISKYISNINKLNYKSPYILYKELNTIFDLDDELYPYLKNIVPNIDEFWSVRTPELWLTNYLKQDFKIKYNKNNLVWYLDDQWIFIGDRKNKNFWVYYAATWRIFNMEYDMQFDDIRGVYRRVMLDPPELRELTPYLITKEYYTPMLDPPELRELTPQFKFSKELECTLDPGELRELTPQPVGVFSTLRMLEPQN